jgi:hypothetical protein
MRRYRTDLWQVGILRAPMADCLTGWPQAEIVWLPAQRPYCFLADPFGVWRDGQLHVFAEAYDYRTKHGTLVRHVFDEKLQWQHEAPVMAQPFHLSYPFLIEEAGALYLLPEAHRSGKLTLYRMTDDLSRGEPVADLLDLPVIDATVIQRGDVWWMFFSLPGSEQEALHAAWAESLTGPWHLHPGNPLRVDRGSSRPGGTPLVHEGALYLPTQDCRSTYGGALQWLRIDELMPERFHATPATRLEASAWATPFTDGMHTLSACGPVTLFDVKRIDRSPRRAFINAQRRLRRAFG